MKVRYRNIRIAIGIILVMLQFVPINFNLGNAEGKDDVAQTVAVPAEIQAILKRSCYDCHSNSTVYPWYANVQPIGLWLQHHVDEGKAELNFTTFNMYSAKRKAHKMQEIVEMVETHEMPLNSYTWIHKEAVLTEADKIALIQWAKISFAAIKSAP